MHLADGRPVAASVADHVIPHHGDWDLFWSGELQSLCRPCHERHKRIFEARGYHREVGPDGWPIDPQHPANMPRSQFRRFGFGIPHNLRASAIPVTLICGPPAGGKSTWVREHKQRGDIVVSLDECKLRVGGKEWDTDRRIFRRAMALRDSMLRTLATQRSGRAFVVIGGPLQVEREAWRAALGPKLGRVVVLDTAAEICLERLRSDPARAHAMAELSAGVVRWWHLYLRPPAVVIPQESAA